MLLHFVLEYMIIFNTTYVKTAFQIVVVAKYGAICCMAALKTISKMYFDLDFIMILTLNMEKLPIKSYH